MIDVINAAKNFIRGSELPATWRTIRFILLIGALFSVALISAGPAQRIVQVSLEQADKVTLSYSSAPSNNKSPVCGCMMASRKEWRGISFIAKDFDIDPYSSISHITAFNLMAAYPGHIHTLPPGTFNIAITRFSFSMPPNAPFNAQVITIGTPEAFALADYRLNRKTEMAAGGNFTIIGDGPLHVQLLGKWPVGAWLPVQDSSVDLKYEFNARTGLPTNRVIQETVTKVPALGPARRDPDSRLFQWPIVDVIGPRIVIWTSHEKAYATGRAVFEHVEQDDGHEKAPSEWQRVTAYLVEVPFAARIVLEDFGQLSLFDIEKEYTALFSESDGQEMELGVRRIVNASTSLSIPNQATESTIRAEVLSDMAKNPVTAYKGGKLIVINGRLLDMWFSAPAIPPVDGFAIFGDVSRLDVRGAVGSIIAGKSPVFLPAPSEVSFREITEILPSRNESAIPIPIEMAGSEKKLRGNFSTSARVMVNGEPVVSLFDRLRSLAEAPLLVLSLIGLISTCFKPISRT